MNKLFTIFLLLIIGLTSCTKIPEFELEPELEPEIINGIWRIDGKQRQDCTNPEDNSSLGFICPSNVCVSAFLCNRENYTFFGNGELEKFTCGAFFGWRRECTYTGTYILIENELTICTKRMRRVIQFSEDNVGTICVEDNGTEELECEVYNCRFTDTQMRLEREVKDGCTEVSVYMR